MRFHCLQHVEFEGPGLVETWIKLQGYSLSFTRFYADDPLPGVNEFDALVIMGGYMSVHDELQFPWMTAEKSLIREAIRQNKKILGICLGAQLVAEALGAAVLPNPHKEIGILPVHFTPEARKLDLFKDFPGELILFHWHGETFELPPGAVRVAFSEACRNQGFVAGNHILALQFHMEVTEKMVREMLAGGSDELIEARYIHSHTKILSGLPQISGSSFYLFRLLEAFLEKHPSPVIPAD
jgi:GMP synthase (glutamine-hydrolysing)